MANNNLVNLHNILFEQVERLNDTSLKGDALKEEIERGRAMANVAQTIVANGRLILESQEMMAEHHSSKLVAVPEYLLAEQGES